MRRTCWCTLLSALTPACSGEISSGDRRGSPDATVSVRADLAFPVEDLGTTTRDARTGVDVGGAADVGAVDGQAPASVEAGIEPCRESTTGVDVRGPRTAWQTVTLDVLGPEASEDDVEPNPFLDVRYEVHFERPDGADFVVPGYFAGDGVGGASGRVFRAHLTPDVAGTWSYRIRFRVGGEVAVDAQSQGAPEEADGRIGQLCIRDPDASAPGFMGRGPLEWVGEHYLYTRDGSAWIKTGADSPENFLAYAGFDGTRDLSGGTSTNGLQDGIHRYPSHEADWRPGDPDWNGGAGRGIIGALNYLASEGVNSVYFLPCNIGGDGRDTWPYVDPGDLLHFDISKLDQWETTFLHAERLGIALHFVLSETESGNENLHDQGQLGTQRRLFYREMVARFAHHNAVFWNIGEENDYGAQRQLAFAGYLDSVDPYGRPTTVHTHKNQVGRQYDDLVGEAVFDMASIQLSPDRAAEYTETWRSATAGAGRPWAIMLDEIGPAGTGVTDSNAAEIRKLPLWPALMSGAGGVEWYFGYHPLPLGGDVRTEDFRTRGDMWRYSRIAREFFEDHLPFDRMRPADDWASGNDAEVFRDGCDVIAVYAPSNIQGVDLDLSSAEGVAYRARWLDPRTGNIVEAPGVTGGETVSVGTPPSNATDDWVYWLKAQTPTPTPTCPGASGGGGGGPLQIDRLVLIDADSDQDIGPIASPATWRLSSLPNLNVRAEVQGPVRSVRFRVNGVDHRTESVAPFALGGDSGGDYAAWTPSLGALRIDTIPYPQTGASGAPGPTVSIDVTVTP